jgi:hypothetical protein
MCIIGLKVVSGEHLSSLRIKPKGRQGKQKHSKFSGSDIQFLCRLGFGLVWDGYLIFVITVGFGYLEKSKSKESLLVLGIWKKKNPRIKELPGPGRYTEKNSESKISDKCPEPATSLILIIPGIFRAFKKSLKELPGFMKEPENTRQFSRLTFGMFPKN